MRRNALDMTDSFVDPVLRVNLNEQMNMIRHDLQFMNFGSDLGGGCANQLLQPRFDLPHKASVPIFWTPDNMVFA